MAKQYYFALRGNASEHGLTDVAGLQEMVKAGQLKPSDFVWDKEAGEVWRSASSVEGLFPLLDRVLKKESR